MSRKVFTAGEVLAAADVNSFLMDQTVMSFAGTAARGSAIPSPVTGMTTYLEDTKDLTIYDGSSYSSPFGLTLLSNQSFTTTTAVIFNNFLSSTYDAYQIVLGVTSTSAFTDARINLRDGTTDISANYEDQTIEVSGTTVNANRNLSAAQGRLGLFSANGGMLTTTFNNPALAARTYGVTISYMDGTVLRTTGFAHNVATAYDGFRITFTNNATGSLKLYGLRK